MLDGGVLGRRYVIEVRHPGVMLVKIQILPLSLMNFMNSVLSSPNVMSIIVPTS